MQNILNKKHTHKKLPLFSLFRCVFFLAPLKKRHKSYQILLRPPTIRPRRDRKNSPSDSRHCASGRVKNHSWDESVGKTCHAPENERLHTLKSWAWEMVIPEKQKHGYFWHLGFQFLWCTLLGTDISPPSWHFLKMIHVSVLEGKLFKPLENWQMVHLKSTKSKKENHLTEPHLYFGVPW